MVYDVRNVRTISECNDAIRNYESEAIRRHKLPEAVRDCSEAVKDCTDAILSLRARIAELNVKIVHRVID